MKQLLGFAFALFLLGNVAFAQSALEGVVKNAEGEPLSFATIGIKGTKVSVVADSTGKFRLATQEALPYVLQIRYVGYALQEIQITNVSSPLVITLADEGLVEEVFITSRRRSETAQLVPIPISVIGGTLVAESGAFNVNRLKELVPTVQLYSSNPRNTTLNIRGLGSTFGLTNDGIDPGVGFYVDGVYYARPAVTTLDFLDVTQIEVLRGPQGTLFGKNTTAGAFNVTTRKPSFTPGASYELSFGNYGFVQAKSSITGPINKKLAARLSFSGTQRDGLIENVATQKLVNDLNNLGVQGKLLYTPSSSVVITLSGDATRQRPDGYAQVVAGVVPTQRAAYRQFEKIISDLNYDLPTRNPFDRVVDHDTPWRSNQDLGGTSLNVDVKIGNGTLTSTSAWRYWNWDPSNDRDFTGLQVLALSQAPSKHKQWSQELRYAGEFNDRLSGVVGLFAIGQNLKTDPYHTEESGTSQWRFSQSSTSPLWQTPGLLDGFGIQTRSELKTFSGAAFAQVDWEILNKLHILPGIRFNYDQKDVTFNRQTYGGLQTTDPALLALKRIVYTDQDFSASVDDNNFSGQVTVAYNANQYLNAYATVSTSYKPVGVNLGGLPTDAGEPMLDLALVKPEYVRHLEFGLKTNPTPSSTVNITFHNTNIKDYQTLVQTAQLGVNRGYLANAEQVRVLGVELDANARLNKHISFYGAFAYTDGVYVSFTNAPVPLEETGGAAAFKDISGGQLPGISKWAGSLGGELAGQGKLLSLEGKFFLAFDAYYRSTFSSSASPSAYLNVEGYALLNGRIGFRTEKGPSFFVWSRNLLDVDYFEQLLPAAGNAGHYAGVLGDPRTFGITLRQSF